MSVEAVPFTKLYIITCLLSKFIYIIWFYNQKYKEFIQARIASNSKLLPVFIISSRGLCISDIPLHDATRDLVLMSEQFEADYKLTQNLEVLTDKLQQTFRELDSEKQKTDRYFGASAFDHCLSLGKFQKIMHDQYEVFLKKP